MNVRLPDGTIIKNVPEGTTQADLSNRVAAFRSSKEIAPTFDTKIGLSAPPPQQQVSSSLAQRVLGDAPIALLKGAIGLPEAAIGLANIPTMGYAGKLTEAIGIKPKEAKDFLNEFLSAQQQEADRRVAQAKGFIPTLQAALENPSVIVQTLLESAPSMIGAAGISRALLKLFPKLAPLLAGSVGEGAVSAGQTAEQVRQATPGGLITPEQAALSLGSGALTTALGVTGGKAAKAVGSINPEELLTGKMARSITKDGLIKRFGKSALVEGLVEELPQSAQEQIAQNLALGRQWDEGVPASAVLGSLSGAALGGAFGAASPKLEAPTFKTDLKSQKQLDEIKAKGVGSPYSPSVETATSSTAPAAPLAPTSDQLLAQVEPLVAKGRPVPEALAGHEDIQSLLASQDYQWDQASGSYIKKPAFSEKTSPPVAPVVPEAKAVVESKPILKSFYVEPDTGKRVELEAYITPSIKGQPDNPLDLPYRISVMFNKEGKLEPLTHQYTETLSVEDAKRILTKYVPGEPWVPEPPSVTAPPATPKPTAGTASVLPGPGAALPKEPSAPKGRAGAAAAATAGGPPIKPLSRTKQRLIAEFGVPESEVRALDSRQAAAKLRSFTMKSKVTIPPRTPPPVEPAVPALPTGEKAPPPSTGKDLVDKGGMVVPLVKEGDLVPDPVVGGAKVFASPEEAANFADTIDQPTIVEQIGRGKYGLRVPVSKTPVTKAGGVSIEVPREFLAYMGLKAGAKPGEIKAALERKLVELHPSKYPNDPYAGATFHDLYKTYGQIVNQMGLNAEPMDAFGPKRKRALKYGLEEKRKAIKEKRAAAKQTKILSPEQEAQLQERITPKKTPPPTAPIEEAPKEPPLESKAPVPEPPKPSPGVGEASEPMAVVKKEPIAKKPSPEELAWRQEVFNKTFPSLAGKTSARLSEIIKATYEAGGVPKNVMALFRDFHEAFGEQMVGLDTFLAFRGEEVGGIYDPVSRLTTVSKYIPVDNPTVLAINAMHEVIHKHTHNFLVSDNPKGVKLLQRLTQLQTVARMEAAKNGLDPAHPAFNGQATEMLAYMSDPEIFNYFAKLEVPIHDRPWVTATTMLQNLKELVYRALNYSGIHVSRSMLNELMEITDYVMRQEQPSFGKADVEGFTRVMVKKEPGKEEIKEKAAEELKPLADWVGGKKGPPPKGILEEPNPERRISNLVAGRVPIEAGQFLVSPERLHILADTEFKKDVPMLVEATLQAESDTIIQIDRFRVLAKKVGREGDIRVMEAHKEYMETGDFSAYSKLSYDEKILATEQRIYLDRTRKRIIAANKERVLDRLPTRRRAVVEEIIAAGGLDKVDLPTLMKKAKLKKADLVEAAFNDWKNQESFGLKNYISRVERGQYFILDKTGGIVAKGITVSEAIDKANRYFNKNPRYKGVLYVSDDVDPLGFSNIQLKAAAADLDTTASQLNKVLRSKGLRVQVKSSQKYSPFMQKSHGILAGEKASMDIMPSYVQSMEKKLALDPILRKLLPKIEKADPKLKAVMEDYIEAIKGKKYISDVFADSILNSTVAFRLARALGFENYGPTPFAFSSAVSLARKATIWAKLGYSPLKAFINLVGGQQHAFVKLGAKGYREALSFIRTPEFKQMWKENEARVGMGATLIEQEMGTIHRFHPLYLFQLPEPINRKVSLAGSYLQALKKGMTKKQAIIEARQQTRFWQNVYNTASLPRLLRSPTGRLVGQFKSYLVKEIEFVATLSGEEMVRYLATTVAMGGPLALVYFIKSIPVLGWIGKLDELEEELRKTKYGRGLSGLTGTEAVPSLVAQLPRADRPMELVGPALSDLLSLFQKIVKPALRGEGVTANDMEAYIKKLSPTLNAWWDFVDSTLGEAGIVEDDRGGYKFNPTKGEKLSYLAGGRPIRQSDQDFLVYFMNERERIEKAQSTDLADAYVDAMLAGREDKMEKILKQMMEQGVSKATVKAAYQRRFLSPTQRALRGVPRIRRGDYMERVEELAGIEEEE